MALILGSRVTTFTWLCDENEIVLYPKSITKRIQITVWTNSTFRLECVCDKLVYNNQLEFNPSINN